MQFRFIVIIFFILVLPVVAFSSSQSGIDIIGVGNDPSAAFRDGIWQIQKVFGRCSLVSETFVRNFVLQKDVSHEKVQFSGSQLDRFYKGVFRKGGQYFAIFRFPVDFIRNVELKKRDALKSRLFASFDSVQYSSIHSDSFGEVSRQDWKIRLPNCIRKFIDFFIWDIDNAKGFEIVQEKE